MTKKNLCVVVAVLTALMGYASAVSLGAGPAVVEFPEMIKGGYAEQVITVSTAGDEPLIVKSEVTGEIKSWASVEEGGTFKLDPAARRDVKIMVNLPIDVPNGRYEGIIYFRAAPASSASGEGTGLSLGAGVGIRVGITVSDKQVEKYELRQVGVKDTEIGFPAEFTATLANTGNVRLVPKITITIMDELKKRTIKTFDYAETEIKPTSSETITIKVPTNGIDVGKYTAKVTADNGQEQEVFFNVLEKGTLALKGILREVKAEKVWVEEGEMVKIVATLENTGELPIEGAIFKGEAYLVDDAYGTRKLVGTFESDQMDVPKEKTVELSSYYTPAIGGRYVIRGEVAYGGKRTQSKDTILNVVAKPTNFLPYAVIVGVIVIAIVYYLTRKTEDGRTRRFKKIWADYLGLK
ncbi:Uncharacterised protein [uncultured archaeon]|nr:Uncharacterised protein [uncultured archaeon]